MKTIISAGDLIDIYYKFKNSGQSKILSRIFSPLTKSRTARAWNTALTERQAYWWSIPAVQKRWNFLISGNSNTNYAEYVVKNYLGGKFNLKMLSPGCGTGNKELKFAVFSCFFSIEAFDVSPDRIEIAKRILSGTGYKNINYFVSDAAGFDYGINKYDVIVFDSFLHHIKNQDRLLEKIRDSLNPGGLLVINEYVGPHRFQFPGEQIKTANEILRTIPSEMRKRWQSDKIKSRIYKPGLLRMFISDPSEAVNSENILSEVRKRFNILEEKPYGGNLLQLVLKDISHNFIKENEKTSGILERLFSIEDDYLKAGHKSDFVFAVYAK